MDRIKAVELHTGGRVTKTHKAIDPETGQEIVVIDEIEVEGVSFVPVADPRVRHTHDDRQKRPQ